jgi:hypothetical protein
VRVFLRLHIHTGGYMPFKLIPVKQLKAKVVFERPLDFGKRAKEDCVITYRKLDQDELKVMFKDLEIARDPESDVTEFDFIRPYVVNIEEVQDENGEELPFNDTVLREMMLQSFMAGPIIMTFINLQIQDSAVKEKN